MADKVMDAVEKLFQFGTNHSRDQAIAGKDLAPVLSAVADALIDLDNRVKATQAGTARSSAETARVKAALSTKASKPPYIPKR
jgi:hypothetical protein